MKETVSGLSSVPRIANFHAPTAIHECHVLPRNDRATNRFREICAHREWAVFHFLLFSN